MKTTKKIAALILLCICSFVSNLQAQVHQMSDHIMVMPKDIKWVDGPVGLPPGGQFAILEGDPSVAGMFTMRGKVPANYKIKPHTHPADEHITVIKGVLFMGMGKTYDEASAMGIPAGGFAVMKAGTVHYAFSKGEVIVQVHGMGPWGITYINPEDDPRIKK
jgi:ChrR-like protein with cupin domain